MIAKEKIESLIEEHLSGSDKFLVDFNITAGNHINVFIDADNGVTINDCINLSRFIEKSLDRDSKDFELNVSSAGIENGLKIKRQYKKNTGRNIEVTITDKSKYTGLLKEVHDEFIVIELSASKKNKKQDKSTFEDLIKKIDFNEIKEAKIIISFK